jgi:hypothetical protein
MMDNTRFHWMFYLLFEGIGSIKRTIGSNDIGT